MQWLRDIFWLLATYNFCITVTFIPSKPNSVADAILRLHDHGLCHVLRDLLSQTTKCNDSYQDLFSQPAFSSLPRQVQSMLKNSYFRKNWDSTFPMPLHNLQWSHTSRSYQHTFVFLPLLWLSTRALPSDKPPSIQCFSRANFVNKQHPNYLNVVHLLHFRSGYPNPLKNRFLNTRKPFFSEVSSELTAHVSRKNFLSQLMSFTKYWYDFTFFFAIVQPKWC